LRALVAVLSRHRWKGHLAEAERLLAAETPPAGGIGAKLDAWLASPAWELRNAAVKLIARCRDQERYARLLRTLTDRSEAGIVRRNAAQCIGRLGLATAPARDALLAALGDPYWEVQVEAIAALARLFPPAEDLELALLHLLFGPQDVGRRCVREPNFEVRMAAALALAHLGSSLAACRALAALSGDDSWLVRSQAVVALGHFAARNPQFFHEVRHALETADRISEGAVSYFVHRDILGQVLRAVQQGPEGLLIEGLRALYLDPHAGWNQVRR
jgi:HEAT repeat protein